MNKNKLDITKLLFELIPIVFMFGAFWVASIVFDTDNHWLNLLVVLVIATVVIVIVYFVSRSTRKFNKHKNIDTKNKFDWRVFLFKWVILLTPSGVGYYLIKFVIDFGNFWLDIMFGASIMIAPILILYIIVPHVRAVLDSTNICESQSTDS